MAERIYVALDRAFKMFFFFILAVLALKGEVFKVKTSFFSLSLTSVKNFIPVFIVWWSLLKIRKKVMPSLWFYMIFVVWFIVTILSPFRVAGLVSGYVLLIYALWFYGVQYVLSDRKTVISSMFVLIGIAWIVNILDLYYHYSVDIREIIERYPFWQGKNALGLFLVFALCLCGSVNAGKKRDWFFKINCVLLIVGIVFSYSRGAWLAAIVSVVGLLLCRFKKIIFVFAACVVLMVIISPKSISDRFGSVFKGGDANIKQRLELWDYTIEIIKKHPIIGTGLGTFEEMYRLEHPNGIPEKGEESRVIRHAHNLYLQMLSEIGVLGFSLFLVLVVIGFKRGIKYLRLEKDELFKSIRYGCLLAVVVFFVYSLTDCTTSWQFMGDSFSHINLLWLMFWAVVIKKNVETEDNIL